MKTLLHTDSFGLKFRTITLGDLIRVLEPIEEDTEVKFNFAGLRPRGFHPFRGYEGHLAIFYGNNNMTVAELLFKAKACVGRAFTGNSGLSFIAGLETLLWIDNPGDCSYTGIQMVQYSSESKNPVVYLYSSIIGGLDEE